MEHKNALEQKKLSSGSPYKPDTWKRLLETSGLISRYPNLPHQLQYGFNGGIPIILETFTPPNKPSIADHLPEFNRIIQLEFEKQRYIGPLSKLEVENLIGPFQTSPLSIIPKPGKPGKFRIIQNLSHPHLPRNGVSSINSSIDSNLFPSTWGTFSVISLLICRLPPGSQLAVRDVKEAYRTVPLAPSQWPGIVVRLHEDDSFAIDTRNCFGLASSSGCYGTVGDAGAQLTRIHGIGPISKWVDDHVFIRILREHIKPYNKMRKEWAESITKNGGEHHDGGKLWFKGATMPDGRTEEFDEDCSTPILDLSNRTPQSAEDSRYTYTFSDIDDISDQLGIPWEREKDIPFGTEAPFIGFTWNLENQTVSIPDPKKTKYLHAIYTWESKETHNLEEVQNSTANSSTLALWSQLGEHTSPAWKNSWLSSVTILSCHTPPLAALATIYSGGNKPSPAPTSPAPSQGPKLSSTSLLTQMLAQKLASASPSETAGEHGASYQDGKKIDETLVGQKPSVSSSSSAPYFQAALQARISKSSEITKASLKAGGKAEAVTLPQTKSSNWYTMKASEPASLSIPVTSQVKTTLLTAHPVVSMVPETSSYHPLPSHMPTDKWLSTLTKNLAQSSLARSVTEQLQSHNQNLTENLTNDQGQSSTTPSNVGQRNYSHKRKAGSDAIHHPATLSLPPPRNTRPSPYSDNLRPLLSPFRPHVLARDRIQLWKPITSRNNLDPKGNPTNLNEADLKRIADVMEVVWEPSTLEGYGTGLLTYHVWCDTRAMPEEQRAPLSPVVAAAFVSTLAGTFSWKTIRNYLYSIRAWQIFHGVKWEMNEPEMEALLKATEKATPESSKRKKRTPYTPHFILAIRNQLDLINSPFEAAVYACLTTIFYACARVGEFTVPTLTAFKPNSHIKPSDVTIERDRNGLQSTAFHLPRTKTSIHGENVSWSRQNGDTDPEKAFSHHLAINQPPQNGPLFAYRHKNTHRPLTKPAFIKALATAATKAGLEPLQGHGICIGSTLEYLLRGIPFEVMKVKGRWASDAFLIYLTKHAQILAPYMQAQPDLHAEFVRLTMPRIRRT